LRLWSGENGGRFEIDRKKASFSHEARTYCTPNTKTKGKVIIMIFSDRFRLSFIVFDEYSKYYVFAVVLLIVRHLDFLGEFKIRGRSLCPFIARLRV